MSTKIGFGSSILKDLSNGLDREVKEFGYYCTQTSKQLQGLRDDHFSFEHLAKPDKKRVLSGLVDRVIELDTLLTPKETYLNTKIERLIPRLEESGFPSDACKQLGEKVKQAAASVREQRDAAKREIAPAGTWSEWLRGSHSQETFKNIATEVTNSVEDFPDLGSPRTPSDDSTILS